MKFLTKFTSCFLLVQVIKATTDPTDCADATAVAKAFKDLIDTDVNASPEAYKATCNAANAYKFCLNNDTSDFDTTCDDDFGPTSTSKFDCNNNKCTVCFAHKETFLAANGDTCENAKALRTCIEQQDKDKEYKLVFTEICNGQCTDGDGKKNCTEVKADVPTTTAATTNATASATASGNTAAKTNAPTVSSTGEAPSEQGDTASGIELSMTLIGAAALLALARRPMLD